MLIDPILKMFFILIAAILGTNAAWLIYVSSIEDEITAMYKILKCQPLSKDDKKKLNKIARRKKSK
ncbi:MAG: hypothetical protein FWC41_06130 [Firmicutes bacterium]|nr:hypothetical protein [Bacillota bacterium]